MRVFMNKDKLLTQQKKFWHDKPAHTEYCMRGRHDQPGHYYKVVRQAE